MSRSELATCIYMYMSNNYVVVMLHIDIITLELSSDRSTNIMEFKHVQIPFLYYLIYTRQAI